MYNNATWPPRDTSTGHAFADIKLHIDEGMNIDIGLIHIRANAGPRWPITCGVSTHATSGANLLCPCCTKRCYVRPTQSWACCLCGTPSGWVSKSGNRVAREAQVLDKVIADRSASLRRSSFERRDVVCKWTTLIAAMTR